MATPGKAQDPAAAALSAIEEALDLVGKPDQAANTQESKEPAANKAAGGFRKWVPDKIVSKNPSKSAAPPVTAAAAPTANVAPPVAAPPVASSAAAASSSADSAADKASAKALADSFSSSAKTAPRMPEVERAPAFGTAVPKTVSAPYQSASQSAKPEPARTEAVPSCAFGYAGE
jgi:hypothetical protein